jgi:hypothetical protein
MKNGSSIARKICWHDVTHEIFHVLTCCMLLASVASSQATQNRPEKLAYGADKANVPVAIAKIKQGDFGLVDIELIAQAGAVEAIPILKEQFVISQDPLTKEKLASALVKLGNKDEVYWNFLVEQATPALNSDAPSVSKFDSQGKRVPGLSSEFATWAEAHNILPSVAAQNARYWVPVKVMLLAETGDPRAVPLLRQGLLSPNYQIQAAAARGLAEAQDKDSIPLIVDACKRAPADEASAIAEPLAYFDDLQAQTAVQTYLTKDELQTLHDARTRGSTPYHYVAAQ